MANEFCASGVTSGIVYVLLRNAHNGVYRFSILNFENQLTANLSNYPLLLTQEGSSGVHFGDMPSVPLGIYFAEYRLRAGGSPAWTDTILDTEEIPWNGTERVSSAEIYSLINAIPTAGQNASANWNALRSDHNLDGSFGQMLRGWDGEAAGPGPGANTIDLGPNAPAGDISRQGIRIVSGPGSGQINRIVSYSQPIPVFKRNWVDPVGAGSKWSLVDFPPDGDIEAVAAPVSILASEVRAAVGLSAADLDTKFDAIPTASENGLATWNSVRVASPTADTYAELFVGWDGVAAGPGPGSNTIDLGPNAPAGDITDQGVRIIADTGAGQVRRITSYAQPIATLNRNWTVLPDATSKWALVDTIAGGPVEKVTGNVDGSVGSVAGDVDGSVGSVSSPVVIADASISSDKFSVSSYTGSSETILEKILYAMSVIVPPPGGYKEMPRDGNGEFTVFASGGTQIGSHIVVSNDSIQKMIGSSL